MVQSIGVFRGGPLDGQWAEIEGGAVVVAHCPLKQAWSPLHLVTYNEVARYRIVDQAGPGDEPAYVRVMKAEEECP